MCDEWMPVVRVPMRIEHFHQLPRHPAYKYEFLGGEALLTPRAKFYHARLDLSRFTVATELEPSEPVEVHPVRESDFPALVELFAGAFAAWQPFASLDDATRLQAAQQSLDKTRTEGDGPWLRAASLVAWSPAEEAPLGAILITLLPEGDALDHHSYHWQEPPREDLVARCGGRPHLTWIFVNPWQASQGIGTILLEGAVKALREMGYKELLSTFLAGNHSSTLWHWRSGFELLSHPFSTRRLRREVVRKRS